MKTGIWRWLSFAILLIAWTLLHAADSTNDVVLVEETWETITNQWGSVSLEQVKQAADATNVSAQYYLGYAYLEGIGTPKNSAQGLKWMNRAADQKYARAQFYMGWLYAHGSEVEQDYVKAAKFYREAAEQGHAMAQNNLGWFYKNGWGVPDDPQKSLEWFQKSADRGEKLAAVNLAWIYAKGVYGATNTFGQGAEAQVRSGGIAPNHELAEKWMKQAVDLNSAEGQYNFADLLHSEVDNEGHQDNSRFPAAGEWFRKAAEQGYDKAQYRLAYMYHTGELGNDQRTNCIPWFLKAAAQGNAEAKAEIADLPKFYPNSELLKTIDQIDLLKQTAEQGNLESQFDLAMRYHHGDSVTKNDSEAFKWMEKAAQHEISPVTLTIDAHYYLGVMYENGDGVAKDLAKAYELYQEAAVGGNKPEPLTRLGQMYEKGDGVTNDDRQAVENYYMATQFGFFPTSDDTARRTAIENLFNLYVEGRGVPADKTLVSQQLDKIKRTPIITAKAQFLLGQIYFQGKLVPQDLVEADVWTHLAANQNFDEARSKLEQVEFVMSVTQKEAAKDRFDDLNRTIEQAKKSYQQLESFRHSHSW